MSTGQPGQQAEHALSQQPLKVVVAGPFGAGKTTFVSTASGQAALGSEVDVSDATARLKASTTVAMDHGTSRLRRVDGSVRRLSLFGAPGQERFSFMWPTLARGMHAYVLLADGSRLQSQAQLKSVVRAFTQLGPDAPFRVALNRWDQAQTPAAQVAQFIGVQPHHVVACDPREPRDVAAVLDALVADIERHEGGAQ